MLCIEPTKLAKLIFDYRMKHHLTQEELAEKLEVPRFTLWRWEKGLVKISYIMFQHLKRNKII